MSNGNDWEQGSGGNDWGQGPARGGGGGQTPGGGGQFGPNTPGGGGGQPPRGGGGGQPPAGGGGGQPPGGSGPSTDLITEGWGGGPEITFDEIIERLKLVFRRATGPVLMAWLGLGAISLLVALIGSLFDIVNYFVTSPGVSGMLGLMHTIFEIGFQPILYVLGAFQFALFRPLHRQIFEGEGVITGPMDAIRDAKGVFLYVFAVVLIMSFGSGLGAACCLIPGLLILFLFNQAPYLAATQGLDPFESLKRSFELNKTYWMVIFALIIGVFVVSTAGGCVYGVGTGILSWLTSILRPFHSPFIVIVVWLGWQLGLFGAFVVQTAIFSTIETKETGRMPA
ncbi:MAG: hypothetical protein ACLFVJ_19420 [Persicimonas sp.]